MAEALLVTINPGRTKREEDVDDKLIELIVGELRNAKEGLAKELERLRIDHPEMMEIVAYGEAALSKIGFAIKSYEEGRGQDCDRLIRESDEIISVAIARMHKVLTEQVAKNELIAPEIAGPLVASPKPRMGGPLWISQN